MSSQGVEKFGYKQELRRSLTFVDLVVYGLIFMVPIAPFAIFGSVFQSSGGMVPLTYIIALVAMIFTANSYAQMAQEYPMAGSVYTYVGRGIARPVGFVAGWMILLDYILVPCLLYLAASLAMVAIIPAIPIWAWLIIFVVLNTLINYLGISLTAKVNKIMLVAELIVLVIYLAIGITALAQGKGGHDFGLSGFYNPETFTFSLIFGAASIAVLSFLGFDAVSTLAEENQGTSKQLARSMIVALGGVAVLFVAQTWVAGLLVEDPDKLIKNGDAAGVAFYETAGFAGGPWLYILTAVSTAIAWGFADALVAQAATSRLLFAMARDRQLPKFLRKVSVKHKVPVNATFLVAILSLILGIVLTILPDGLALISTMVNFGALTAFSILNVAVMWHFYIKKKTGRWFIHLVCPIIGLCVLGAVLYNARETAQTVGLIWLAIGIVLSIVLLRRGVMKRDMTIDESGVK
ncbi:APC family permease [Spelaeicoccus albus]|uniref:Amino acid transporter n=1 Tax=Spelaeicoccus albus TaxID=1280376 RepID=A0A7Z0IJ09_9MICO|nr:APC family permease [Spelaeicoccus albus]NYI69065.1 amino acid transporter [Spelaeicoccus albus]